MTEDQKHEINELISIKAMALMLAEKADKLIEKLSKGSTPAISKNKNKMKKELEKFHLKRMKTRERAAIRINAEKSKKN